MKPLQNMKIRIKDAEHSKQVQEHLFKLGFGWLSTEVQHTNTKYLYADDIDCNQLQISYGFDDWFFDEDTNKEVTLEDLQAMLVEPDEITEGSFTTTLETSSVSVPTFSVDDTINTYIHQLQKRLVDTNLSVSIYGDEIRVANTDNDDDVGVKSWDDVLEVIKVKQAYLDVFKGN